MTIVSFVFGRVLGKIFYPGNFSNSIWTVTKNVFHYSLHIIRIAFSVMQNSLFDNTISNTQKALIWQYDIQHPKSSYLTIQILFSFVKLLSKRVLPSLRNTHKALIWPNDIQHSLKLVFDHRVSFPVLLNCYQRGFYLPCKTPLKPTVFKMRRFCLARKQR